MDAAERLSGEYVQADGEEGTVVALGQRSGRAHPHPPIHPELSGCRGRHDLWVFAQSRGDLQVPKVNDIGEGTRIDPVLTGEVVHLRGELTWFLRSQELGEFIGELRHGPASTRQHSFEQERKVLTRAVGVHVRYGSGE